MSATYFLRTTDMAALEQLGIDLGLLVRHPERKQPDGSMTPASIGPVNPGRDMWDVIGVLHKPTGKINKVTGELGSFDVPETKPVVDAKGVPYLHVNLTLGLNPEIDPVTQKPLKSQLMTKIAMDALVTADEVTTRNIQAALAHQELFFILADGEAVDPKDPARVSL